MCFKIAVFDFFRWLKLEKCQTHLLLIKLAQIPLFKSLRSSRVTGGTVECEYSKNGGELLASKS